MFFGDLTLRELCFFGNLTLRRSCFSGNQYPLLYVFFVFESQTSISADPPPRVVLIDEQKEDLEEEKKDEKSLNDKYEEQKPKLVGICRSETEGKNTTKYIVELIIKNWQFRTHEAKILSICMEKHDRIESIQFTRTKLTKEALESLHLPNSGTFTCNSNIFNFGELNFRGFSFSKH